jgi:hypothetical protein
MQGKFYQSCFLYIPQSHCFSFRLLHISSQWTKWQQRTFVSEFNWFCSINHHFSRLVHHCPLNCATALSRQRIITFSVFKFCGFTSDAALDWLHTKEVRRLSSIFPANHHSTTAPFSPITTSWGVP